MESRDRIAYLASLSLFFSAIEIFIPKPLPFFRIGLANIPILYALTLDMRSFMLLALLKGIGNAYVSGTLFSVFALMSVAQTLASALAMYGARKLSGSALSIYGISSLGAAVSAAVQILIAALYVGRGTLSFLPLMLLISLPASIATAHISGYISIPERIPEEIRSDRRDDRRAIAPAIISLGAIMMTQDVLPSLAAFLSALILQRISGKRIRLSGHIMMLLFMLISSALTPSGRVIFTILGFPVTENAIISALSKSFRLSAAVSLSLTLSSFRICTEGILGDTLSISSFLLSSFRNARGNLINRIKSTLSLEVTAKETKQENNIPVFTLYIFSAISIGIMLISYSDLS